MTDTAVPLNLGIPLPRVRRPEKNVSTVSGKVASERRTTPYLSAVVPLPQDDLAQMLPAWLCSLKHLLPLRRRWPPSPEADQLSQDGLPLMLPVGLFFLNNCCLYVDVGPLL